MGDDFFPPLRLFRADAEPECDPHTLACRELLRPVDAGSTRRGLEPFSRSWFEELELKRYARNGSWLPRVLEFSRHSGESLLMLRPGLGTDAIQYQRHGVDVTVCTTAGDEPDWLAKNFTLRGLSLRTIPADGHHLPFHSASFDLAYVNALHDSHPPAGEIIRVLRPGGKLFALFPARFGLGFWLRVLLPWQRWLGGSKPEAPDHAASAATLRQSFLEFEKHRIGKRHLRRADLPTAWKVVPHSLAERMVGEVIVLRAFKPLRAGKQQSVRAA
ncbi:MAG TPA: class I SAM-dependent methyltransferase [Fimbriiglobus sp.]|jgi:SAM-dependent methyltransferase